MKLLITGASGQLGREIVRQAATHEITLLTPPHDQMDITRSGQVKSRVAELRPDMIVNAAAYTDVDGAESEAEKAFAVNATGPANLARVCARYQIPLIHVSTDFVFDGAQQRPYRETDPIAPLGVYGQSKSAGEEKIRSALSEHIIIRTAWLYGIDGHNFVKTMLTLAGEKTHIRVVNDQFGSPTSASDLADALLHIAMRVQNGLDSKWGTYHYCGLGITTWYEFAECILAFAKPHMSMPATHLEPIATADWPARAKRPPFSALDCSRINEHFGIQPRGWQLSLKATVDRILTDPPCHAAQPDRG
jgi:dTDP-4-dehydrorhamnose reductase